MTEPTFRNAYKLAEHHRDFARWMRDNGHEKIGGETPEYFERTADSLDRNEDRLRGLFGNLQTREN